MSDVRRTMVDPISREAVETMLRDQARELPADFETSDQRWRREANEAEAERKLRDEWKQKQQRQAKRAVRQQQQVPAIDIDARIAAALDVQLDAVGEFVGQIRQQLQDQQTRALNRLRADSSEKLGQLRGEIIGRLDVLAPKVEAMSRELQQRGATMDARDFELQAVIRNFREVIQRCNRIYRDLFEP
jgi:hypothetical protein